MAEQSSTAMVTESRSGSRLNDLDALRAAAMLLGILLHAILTHMPELRGLWPVSDSQTSPLYGLLLSAIHGFRMQLFFLISGFFTAMLWRRRGLKALLWHRFRRIFLPLLVGVFTIIPAVWAVGILAGWHASNQPAAIPSVWTAARDGDVTKLTELIEGGVELEEHDAALGVTPLGMAAVFGQPAAARLLLSAGANSNTRNRDNSTPAHAAFLFGHARVAQALLEADVDLSQRDNTGATPVDALAADDATTGFIAELVGLPFNAAKVAAGREQIRESLKEYELPRSATGNLGTSEPMEATEPGQRALQVLYQLVFMFPFFNHLWFLSFLCWLVCGFAIYAWIANHFRFQGLPGWMLISPVRYLWLIPLTVLPAAQMGLIFESFGPDTSAGLLPLPHVLLYYAIFFGFGVLYYDANDETRQLGRRWWLTLPFALLVVFPLGIEFTTGRLGFGERLLDEEWFRAASVFLQVVYAWLMTCGFIGLFRAFYSQESKWLRYLSDSAYWLYLLHLPLVMLVQIYTADWQLNSMVKVALVTGVVSVTLLLCYEWFVRYTWIGTLLNGRKVRPEK